MEAMSVDLREGAGIGLLAGFSAIEDLRNGKLVRVLPDYHTHSRNVYALIRPVSSWTPRSSGLSTR
jgi:DNA-binding transcriptional LysR family regulator